ncbi:polynucleotide adenylyltransferase PcnB [Gammaproteobacteria bacterium]|nr:polynucleotide adenylyltransferase PcnB [Gammaproteobacteria bacterium]
MERRNHTISRKNINHNALKVLYKLNESGFSAYLVGGCVRDLLLGHKPKDFDIATNAHPEEIRKVFKNCRLIGRRFRLAHVFFGREIIEVATFRTNHENSQEQHGKILNKMIIRDNVYGTIEDDAWRRDFRINALYYNVADFSIMDYTGGMKDIKQNILHIIGDPDERYNEDPVRLLRTIRFMAKLNIKPSHDTEEPIVRLSHLLDKVSSARLYQEVLKFFQEGASLKTIKLLQKYNVMKQLFPLTNVTLQDPLKEEFIYNALENTDQRVKDNKTVSPAFLFAILLIHPFLQEVESYKNKKIPFFTIVEKSLQTIFKQQNKVLAITKLMQANIREICMLQFKFNQRRGNQPHRLLEHPKFRAAYDLLILRSKTDKKTKDLSDWWIQFYESPPEHRENMLKKIHKLLPPTKKKISKKPIIKSKE